MDDSREQRLVTIAETLTEQAEVFASEIVSSEHVQHMDEAEFRVHCLEETVLDTINHARLILGLEHSRPMHPHNTRLVRAATKAMDRITPEFYARNQAGALYYFALAMDAALEAIKKDYESED